MDINILKTLLCCLMMVSFVECLDNGLARRPPMGWLTWERFRCNTDCKRQPDTCISERLIKEMAEQIVSGGYHEAGYKYVTIDDCWSAKQRDKNGRLQPDPERFPSGMQALAKFVHSKGLKFGIYGDVGYNTCAGFPGSEFYMQLDAQTFADWGVDLLKFDGCNANPKDSPYGYPTMGLFLKKTSRPIVYSCEWPLYDIQAHIKSNYTAISETCNTWRNYYDVQDSWSSVMGIVKYYMKDAGNFSSVAKPGAWNDPDMLVIGNYGLSEDQERAQMAMWAIFAAPLIMSVDLRNIRPSSKSVLLNKRVIAVNQDALGIQGNFVSQMGSIQLWVRPVLPKGSLAFVLLNTQDGGGPTFVSIPGKTIGLTNQQGYNITETFDGKSFGVLKPQADFECYVNPSGVFMATAVPRKR